LEKVGQLMQGSRLWALIEPHYVYDLLVNFTMVPQESQSVLSPLFQHRFCLETLTSCFQSELPRTQPRASARMA
jgi:hypothetical protein